MERIREMIIDLEISIERGDEIYQLKNKLHPIAIELKKMDKRTNEYKTYSKQFDNLVNYIFKMQ